MTIIILDMLISMLVAGSDKYVVGEHASMAIGKVGKHLLLFISLLV
jgi:hypothetical protein